MKYPLSVRPLVHPLARPFVRLGVPSFVQEVSDHYLLNRLMDNFKFSPKLCSTQHQN